MILNTDALKEFYTDVCAEDADLLSELKDDFIADSKTQIELITSSRASSDWESLSRGAHTLKSTSASMGSSELKEIAYKLEQAAGSSDGSNSSEIDQLIQEIQEALPRFSNELTSTITSWA